MDGHAALTDETYQEDRRKAETVFLTGYTGWVQLLTSCVEQIRVPDESDLQAEVSAILSGESPNLETSKPPVSGEIVGRLGKLCREYARSEISARARLLGRCGLSGSDAVSNLREQAKQSSEEARRKFDYGVKQVSECFECHELVEVQRHLLEDSVQATLIEILEPEVWMTPPTPKPMTEATAATDISARPMKGQRGPKKGYETAWKVAAIVQKVGGEKWVDSLEDICETLDHESIPRPKIWPKRGHRNWCLCLDSEPHLVRKAIGHHLKLAKERPPETFS